jgi:hypothetical protein
MLYVTPAINAICSPVQKKRCKSKKSIADMSNDNSSKKKSNDNCHAVTIHNNLDLSEEERRNQGS